MKSPPSRRPFADAAIAAFPHSMRSMALQAVQDLVADVDDSYRQPSRRVTVSGEEVHVPYRFHFIATEVIRYPAHRSPLARCLLSRSTDGHLRQSALRSILTYEEAWVIPFIVLLVGEYVVEIVEEIQSHLPTMNQSPYVHFVRENRDTMRLLRARAVSYWDRYYRQAYPDRKDYPGLAVLSQLEQWAS
jgi:hypothetical protein